MVEAQPSRENAEILLLAGGAARRFPGKLLHPVGGTPMLVRAYVALRKTEWRIRILADAALPSEIATIVDAPVLLDRVPHCGPLFALADACSALRDEYVFAAAADMPQLDATVVERLVRAWRPGDDAVVPTHDHRIEPLASLYRRRAVLDAWRDLRRTGRHSMHALIEHVAARLVPLPAAHFTNVNRPNDLKAEAGIS